MPPDFPPVFVAADVAATKLEHRAILLTQADIALVIAGAAITLAAALISRQPYQGILSSAAAAAFLLLWAEKSFSGKLGLPRDWFESRAVAESAKSQIWRYMMRVAPYDGQDADSQYLEALHATLASHDEPPLEHGSSRLDERQITPYMRLVRALSPGERKTCYLSRRLRDQFLYYTARAKIDARAGRQWRIVGLVFRGAAFALALLRF
jgi:hypothetical protein